MDPKDPNSFSSRTERLSTGRTYHFIDEKPTGYTKGAAAFGYYWLGFRASSSVYGWRYQIGPWVRRGWRVIVPDFLGYGSSDKPTSIDEYTTQKLCADFAALLDAEGISKVIVVGHDWGAATAWRFALWYPERVRMIACLSIPFYPPAPSYIPLPVMAKRVPLLGYQLYLANEESTKAIESNPSGFVDIIFRGGSGGTTWAPAGEFQKYLNGEKDRGAGQDLLSPGEFKFYVDSFGKDMHGPLAYYKTSRLRFDEEKAAKLPSHLPASLPALFIRGTEDPTSPPDHARRAKNFVPSLERVDLLDAGHWLMVERKDEVEKIVGDWIEGKLKAEKEGVSAKL